MKRIRINCSIINTLLTFILLVLLFVLHKQDIMEFSGIFGMHFSTGIFGIMVTMLTMHGMADKELFQDEKTDLLGFSVLSVSFSFILSCVLWLLDGNAVSLIVKLVQMFQYMLITSSFTFFFAYLLAAEGKKTGKKFIAFEVLFYLIFVPLVLSGEIYDVGSDGLITGGKIIFLPSLVHLVHYLFFAVFNLNICRKFFNRFLLLILILAVSLAATCFLKKMDCSSFFVALSQMFCMLSYTLKKKKEDYYLNENLLDDLCKENTENELNARDLLKEGREDMEAVIFYCRFRELKTAKERDRIQYIPIFNDYALNMAKIIKENGGILLGIHDNALIASFVTIDNKHNYPFMAVKAALKLKHQVNMINENNTINEIPDLNVGISIALIRTTDKENSVGDFGYPTIGKTLKLAKEIESTAFNDEVLITEKIREICGGRITTGQRRKIKFNNSENYFYFYPVEEEESLI